MKVKVIATKKFEGIRDAERNVYPKEGDTWITSLERAEFLKDKGVIEIIEEIKEEPKVEINKEKMTKTTKEDKPKKKKTNKKK